MFVVVVRIVGKKSYESELPCIILVTWVFGYNTKSVYVMLSLPCVGLTMGSG
jgi:hypothetical protein